MPCTGIYFVPTFFNIGRGDSLKLCSKPAIAAGNG